MSKARMDKAGRMMRQMLAGTMGAAFLAASWPVPVMAQTSGGSASSSASSASASQEEGYSTQQLDALLAPIALYPDQLLTQILMASTFPDEVQAAWAWVQQPANKSLTGDALDKALVPMNWDPSVKSLVPFPQVLETMSSNLDWTKQLGYAMTVQQSDVFTAVQRLRQQAQENGQLKSNTQQTVQTQGANIVIVPAQPSVVYVPVYNPTVVYGVWPYPAYPPVYYPPPPGYAFGSALLTGMAFGAGIAITAGLWGWCSPNWGHGNVYVNVNRYNNINVNRAQINNSNWNANNRNVNRTGGNFNRPPNGPVGQPRPSQGLPANSIGRPKTSVPGNIARPPAGMGAGTGAAASRPNIQRPPGNPSVEKMPSFSGGGSKPAYGQGGMGQGGMGQSRPNGGQMSRPAGGSGQLGGTRGNSGPAAFNGMGDGRSAAQFGSRGAQSQRSAASFNRGGGGFGGGGGRRR